MTPLDGMAFKSKGFGGFGMVVKVSNRRRRWA